MPNSPKLKVGLVFDDSLDSNDGVAQYVKTLGEWLTIRGHEVCYLVGETNLKHWHGGRVYSLAINLKVRFNGNRLSMPFLSKKSTLHATLNKEQFDVLHVMAPYSPLMAQRLIILASPQTAIIGTFHIFPSGWLSKIGSQLLRLWLLRSLKRFDGFASVSRPAQVFAKAYYGINSSIIPNPIDIAKFKSDKSNQKNIVFLGRLVKRKGCRQLIEAFAKVQADFPEYKLVIAGDGPERLALEKLTRQLNISDRVHFLGFIEESSKPDLLGSATIACFPSMYGESFGLVLIEAMAAGAQTVLGGDNPGYSSVLAENPKLLFNPRDIDTFASKLRLFINSPGLRKEIANWQTKSVGQYDIDKVGRQIVALYEQSIAKKHIHRHN